MTSAIPGQSVAAVRKTLNEIRKCWVDHTMEQPLYLTQCLSNGMRIEDFSLQFVLGHHSKRASKSQSKKTPKVAGSKRAQPNAK